MQPYDDLAGHYRETPGETLVVVGMDLASLALVVLAALGTALDPALSWTATVAGALFVLWVVGIWTLVARWRGWE